MLPDDEAWVCPQCDSSANRETENENESPPQKQNDSSGDETALEQISTAESGTVRKHNAMKWLDSLEPPSDSELR